MAADGESDETRGAALTGFELAIAAGAALLVSWAATFPIRRLAGTLGLLDRPNERSSHRVATPRGGGIAVVLGVTVALAIVEIRADVTQAAWVVFAVAASLALIGLADDHRGLPPGVRLVFQFLLAAVVVWVTGPIQALPLPAPMDLPLGSAIIAVALSIVWLVGVTNFFNFMDGIDGLAAGQATVTCIGILVAGWSDDARILATAVGAGGVGFLFHNWPPARIFMGDVGSAFFGFSVAALPFLAPAPRRHDATLAVAVGMALFLLDPAVTLLRRAVERKPPMKAHREHLYQQIARPAAPVAPVTSAYLAAGLMLALLGAAGYRHPSLAVWGCLVSLILFAAVWVIAKSSRSSRAGRQLGA